MIDVNERTAGARVTMGDRDNLELFAQIGTSVGNVWVVRDPDSGVIAIATTDDLDGDRYELTPPPDPNSPENRAQRASDMRAEAARLEEGAQTDPAPQGAAFSDTGGI